MKKNQTETWPQIICQLAKKKDAAALTRMIEKGISLNIVQGEENALKILAKEGDFESVEFLLSKFHLNREDAIAGYAYSGYVDQVNQLIKSSHDMANAIIAYAHAGRVNQVKAMEKIRNDSGDSAAMGYAWGGFKQLVEEQLNKGADFSMVIVGYARGGHFKEVQDLLKREANKQLINDAVFAFARGGYVEHVNTLIKQGASLDSAVRGYATAGYITEASDLIGQGASIHSAVKGYASSGHIQQVNALLKLGANIDGAVDAFAMKGDEAQVNRLIEMGANREVALIGYVFSGHMEAYEKLLEECMELNLDAVIFNLATMKLVGHVNYLLAKGKDSYEALRGYAWAGLVRRVNELIACGADINAALKGYASAGHIRQVNELINWGADRATAVEQYEKTPWFSQGNILSLMAGTEDVLLRNLLAKKAKEKDLQEIDILKKRAININKIMKVYELDFKKAQALTQEGARTWLLQGVQLFKDKTIPIEIFFLISFFLTGLKKEEVLQLVLPINNKLWMDTKAELTNKWESGFFHSRQDYESKLNEVEDNYQNRIQFPSQN